MSQASLFDRDAHIGYYSRQINQLLKDDTRPEVSALIPIDPDSPTQLPEICAKGVLLIHLINRVKAQTIKGFNEKPRNVFEVLENQNKTIEGAIALGCKVVGITSHLLADDKKPTSILALTWQILRYYLVSEVSVKYRPDMLQLLKEGEDVNAFVDLTPEQRLLRWANHNLEHTAFAPKTVKNFNKDWSDGDAYVYLMERLNTGIDVNQAIGGSRETKFDLVIKAAAKLGVNTVTAKELMSDDDVFNLAFVASLFQASSKTVDLNPPTDKNDKSQEEYNKKLEQLLAAEKAHEDKIAQDREELAKKALELLAKEKELDDARRKMEEELARQRDAMQEELSRHKAQLEQENQEKLRLEREKQEEALAANMRNVTLATTVTTSTSFKDLDETSIKGKEGVVDIPNVPIRKLYVTICEGHNLIQCDVGSESDPYVVVHHFKLGAKKPVSKHKTKVIKDNQVNPKWFETMEIRNFEVTDTLVLNVWDWDYTGKDFMGQAIVTRSNIKNGKSHTFHLGPKPNSKSKKKITGDVRLEFECFYYDT
eukprot:TRINITY_DN1306_c0_g1_i1.p1 TRINITY_DN1306_c0_g1~~TRINITY_DN1306_c0_g1_i1.p1  ORF type:complete len:539 (+),score=163.84 TRINITY_DN1306_c0_g1_i1:214-1830(+)